MNTVYVIWVDDTISTKYIDRLNKDLDNNYVNDGKYRPPHTIATINKEVLSDEENSLKLYRPMVVFDYDENKKSQKCFALSHFHARTGRLEEYQIPGPFGHVELHTPVEIPTEYLKILNHTEEITKIEAKKENSANDHKLLQWLLRNEQEYKQVCIYGNDILKRYKCITNLVVGPNCDDIEQLSRANKMLIDEKKVKEFCSNELEYLNHKKNMVQKPIFDEKTGWSAENEQRWKKYLSDKELWEKKYNYLEEKQNIKWGKEQVNKLNKSQQMEM